MVIRIRINFVHRTWVALSRAVLWSRPEPDFFAGARAGEKAPRLRAVAVWLRGSVVAKQCCGSGFGFAWIRKFCLDPDPKLKFRIRIQQKVKEHINRTVNSGLFVLLDSSIE